MLGALVVGGSAALTGVPSGKSEAGNAVALVFMTAIGLILPIVLFRWRPPKYPRQTSRYQAVRVTIERSFWGRVKAVDFAFTHPGYAKRYADSLARASAALGDA